MSISSVSSIANLIKSSAVTSSKASSSSNSSSSNSTTALTNQEATLQSQLQQVNLSGGDEKTKQAKIAQIQSQIQTIQAEIAQAASSSTNTAASTNIIDVKA